MKSRKKMWLAIIGAASLIVATPGLAMAARGAPSAAHHSYAPAAAGSLRHTLPLAHPAHPFRTHPVRRGGTHSSQRGTKFSTVSSANWSGFATYGNHFRYVSSTYTIPSLNCSISPDGSLDSQWVGLDGYGSRTVEQTGTYAQCSGGTPDYFAFYEMYPLDAVDFTGVNPGDSITSTVYYNGSKWELTLVDNTNGGLLAETESCPSGSTCHNASAEIVSEVPNGGPPAAELADYGIVGFTHIGITDTTGHRYNILSPRWKNDKINEVDVSNNNHPMQAPSKLEGTATGTGGGWGNQAFTDTALASQ